jgi:hypothetical protein
MCPPVTNDSNRRFRRQCQIAVASSLVLYVTCSQASLRLHNSATGLVLSGLAGAFFFTEVLSFGLLVTRLRDEFQRILLTRSFVWATLITMCVTTIWGFIELHGHGRVPHLNVIWIPMLLICVTAAAKMLIFRQYRPENE